MFRRQRPNTIKPEPSSEPASARADVDLAARERERIYADLHDDIGAKLMELVHLSDNTDVRALAREALDDLRDIVSRTRAIEGSLLQVLEMIQTEAQRRLLARGIELVWDQQVDLPDPALADTEALHLFRIFREATSNAIRHGHAARLRIRTRLIGGELAADVTDDGPGPQAVEVGGGRGTRNIQARAMALGGTAAWEAGTEGGTKVVLRMPLPPTGLA